MNWTDLSIRAGEALDPSLLRLLRGVTSVLKPKRQRPGSAGALIVYSIVVFELPSATARQNDRLTLRKQFLAKVPFAV